MSPTPRAARCSSARGRAVRARAAGAAGRRCAAWSSSVAAVVRRAARCDGARSSRATARRSLSRGVPRRASVRRPSRGRPAACAAPAGAARPDARAVASRTAASTGVLVAHSAADATCCPALASARAGPLGLGALAAPSASRRELLVYPDLVPRGASRSRCGGPLPRRRAAAPRAARARHRVRDDPRLPPRRRHPPGQLARDRAARPADEQPVPRRAGPRRHVRGGRRPADGRPAGHGTLLDVALDAAAVVASSRTSSATAAARSRSTTACAASLAPRRRGADGSCARCSTSSRAASTATSSAPSSRRAARARLVLVLTDLVDEAAARSLVRGHADARPPPRRGRGERAAIPTSRRLATGRRRAHDIYGGAAAASVLHARRGGRARMRRRGPTWCRRRAAALPAALRAGLPAGEGAGAPVTSLARPLRQREDALSIARSRHGAPAPRRREGEPAASAAPRAGRRHEPLDQAGEDEPRQVPSTIATARGPLRRSASPRVDARFDQCARQAQPGRAGDAMHESSSSPCGTTSAGTPAGARLEREPAEGAEQHAVVASSAHRDEAERHAAGEGEERDLDVVGEDRAREGRLLARRRRGGARPGRPRLGRRPGISPIAAPGSSTAQSPPGARERTSRAAPPRAGGPVARASRASSPARQKAAARPDAPRSP